MRFKQDDPVLVGEATGSIGSRWTRYSLGAGVSAQYRLGGGSTLKPGAHARRLISIRAGPRIPGDHKLM